MVDFEHFLTTEAGEILRAALDVLIVYYVVYRALLVLRGTRAVQIGLGLIAVFALYLISQALQLTTVLSILSALISSIILIIVVVFQSDIRRGLQRVGSRALLGKARAQETRVIDEVVEAATELARHRIGALIAFEQDASLDEFVGSHQGEEIDAVVSRDLLVSIFIPEGTNKLHDGAVILRDLRIAKAGVFFPMTSAVVDPTYGSRHRAALGITEETDAVVVAVSEERGTISFCFNGNIVSNLDGQNLRSSLLGIFSPNVGKRKRRTWRERLLLTSAGSDAEKPAEEGAKERPPESKQEAPTERVVVPPAEPAAAKTEPAVARTSATASTEDAAAAAKEEAAPAPKVVEVETPPEPLRKKKSPDAKKKAEEKPGEAKLESVEAKAKPKTEPKIEPKIEPKTEPTGSVTDPAEKNGAAIAAVTAGPTDAAGAPDAPAPLRKSAASIPPEPKLEDLAAPPSPLRARPMPSYPPPERDTPVPVSNPMGQAKPAPEDPPARSTESNTNSDSGSVSSDHNGEAQ